MQLEKFYVDVVAENGSGCIGYAARLHGLGLSVTLASSLRWPAGSGAVMQRRTSRGRLPEVPGGTLHWLCPALGLDGTWSEAPQAARIGPSVLWRDGAQSVTWEVLAHRARVELRTDDGPLAGWGYAERLTMSTPPWRLPIDALWWGRFVSPMHSIIWIRWEHSTARGWLLHDGIEAAEFTVDGTHLKWGGYNLAFENTRVLRSGKLADSVFARWPPVKSALPQRILDMQETKWRSAGVLSGADGNTTRGWVIHEHVRFR